MRSKKLLSLILVLCMILPLIPVFATEGTQTEATSGINYIINHEFDDDADLNAWAKCDLHAGAKTEFDITRAELEDAEDGHAMALTAPKVETAGSYNGYFPVAILDFADIAFGEGKKTIIEMRLKHTGTSAGDAGTDIKLNRPLKYDPAVNNWYGEWTQSWWSAFLMEENALKNRKANDFTQLDTFGEVDTINKWAEVKIVIDEGAGKYSIETKIGDNINTVKDINYNDYSKAKEVAECDYNSLKTIAVGSRVAQTVYLDYLRVYETEPVYTDAQILGGSTVKYDEAAQIKFINAYADEEKTTPSAVAAIPDDGFIITDKDGEAVEAEQSFDAATQIASVKPVDGFVKGETYTVAFNEGKFSAAGIKLTGTKSFTVRARGERSGGAVIYDTFANGTDGWEIGLTNNPTAVVTEVPEENVEGAKDGKALKITFPAKASGAYGSVSKLVGDGIEFKDGSTVVVEARVLKTNEASDFHIRVNRPDSATQIVNDSSWLNYGIVYDWANKEGMAVLGGITPELSEIVYGFPSFSNSIPSTIGKEIANKWVTYKFEFKPTNKEYTTTITYTNGDEEVTLGTASSVMYASKTALDKEYGEGYFNAEDMKYYNALDRITFTSFTAGDIYIDYVKAYEKVETKAVMAGGSTFEADKGIKLQFVDTGYTKTVVAEDESTTEEFVESKLDLIPEGSVTIEGVTAAQSFDKETQTLTLTPSEAIKIGDTCKVTINKAVLADVGIEYKGTEEFSVRARGKRSNGVVVNDTFANGSDDWKVGLTNNPTAVVTEVPEENVAGAKDGKALKITFPAKASGAYGSVSRLVDNGIEFKDEASVIVEARVLKTNEASDFHIRVNRPDSATQIVNDSSWLNYGIVYDWAYPYGMAVLGNISPDQGDVEYGFPSFSTCIPSTANTAIANKWVTYKFEFKPAEKKYYTTITYTDDNNEEVKLGTASSVMHASKTALDKEYGEGYFNADDMKYYNALDRITFTSFTAGDIYVDYVKVYEQFEAKAIMPEGSSVKYDEAIKLKFVSDNVITAIPADAVKIGGVAAKQDYDPDTKTLSVKLADGAAFKKGESYEVAIDKAVLAEDGIIYTGTESFNVRARDARSTGFVVDDNFATGTVDWTVGLTNNATPVVTEVPEENVAGAKDGKALKITFPAKASGAYGSVSRLVGDGIEFNDDKTVVIEARVLKTNEASDFHIRVNRPDSATQIVNDSSWLNYGIVYDWAYPYGMAVLGNISPDQGDVEYGFPSFSTCISSTENTAIANKWVTYKFEFKPAEKKYYTTITYTGDNNEEVTLGTASSVMHASKTALDKEYGEGYFNAEDMKYYNALDRITFTSFTAGDIYVDYVKAYEIYEAFATMPEGSSVKYDEAIKLVFESSQEIPSIPEGAVLIGGEAAKQDYDPDTKTLLVTLANGNNFAENTEYNVTIDKAVLATVGITYTGTEEFKVTGRGARETTGISDNFADANHGWTVGTSASDDYKAKIDVVPDDGAKDGSALMIEFPARGTETAAQYGSVTKKLGNGIEFSNNENVVIEARIKQAQADGMFALKLNRPDTIEQFENDIDWPNIYSLLIRDNYGVNILEGIYPDYSDKDTYWYPKMTTLENTADFDFKDKWVTYKTVLDYAKKKIYTTITYTDGDQEVTLVDNDATGILMATRWDIDSIHGKGAFELGYNCYKSLDRITFTSINDCDIYVDYVNVYTTSNVKENISAKLMAGTNEADVLTAGQTVVPTFELQPKNAVETAYYTISAVYVDGKLDKFTVTPVTTTGTTTTHAAYTVPDVAGKVEIKAFVWTDKMVPLCNAASAVKEAVDTFTVYVRENGSDSATGADAPVATLNEALNRVYASDADAAQIIMGDGNYKVTDTITIPSTASIPDGGLTIKAENNRKAVFVGGNTYTYEDMVKVADNDAIFEKVPAGTKGRLYKIALSDIADIPAVSYPGTYAYGVDKVVKGLGLESDETLTDVTLDAAFDGKLMTIARWPNVTAEGKNDYAKAKSVSGNVDEVYHTILKLYADAAAVEALDATTKETLKAEIQKGITVGVPTDKDISGWDDEGALMFGYWGRDWATQTMPIKAADNSAKTITSKYASSFGFQNNARFYVYNILSELDADGEYYIDRTNKFMYFCKDSAPTKSSKVTISTLDSSKSMLNIASDKKVTVDGLVFENSRGEGIYLQGSTGTVIKNCEIRNLGYRAMAISARECRVENNYIHDTNGGIILSAQDSTNDVKNLTESNNVIHNNEIKNYGRLDQTYVDGIELKGTGNTVSYNKIHDAEHLAVRISGYNNTFIHNEITDVLNQVDDAGAIYVGRSWANRGNKIVSNYIHDIESKITSNNPIAGIFLDDHYAGAYIEGNVFKNITGDGIRGNRGRENTITNNLFIRCTMRGVRISSNNYVDGKSYDNTPNYDSIFGGKNPISDYRDIEIWTKKFPTLCAIMTPGGYTKWGDPAAVTVTKNLAIGCGTGVSVDAFTATYKDTFELNGESYNFDSDVSNNGGEDENSPAVLGADKSDTNAKAYVTASVSADTYSDIVANPGAATAARASVAGITGFTAIDWAGMRK